MSFGIGKSVQDYGVAEAQRQQQLALQQRAQQADLQARVQDMAMKREAAQMAQSQFAQEMAFRQSQATAGRAEAGLDRELARGKLDVLRAAEARMGAQGSRGQDIQEALGWGGLQEQGRARNLREDLGWGGLDQQGYRDKTARTLGRDRLDLDRDLGERGADTASRKVDVQEALGLAGLKEQGKSRMLRGELGRRNAVVSERGASTAEADQKVRALASTARINDADADRALKALLGGRAADTADRNSNIRLFDSMWHRDSAQENTKIRALAEDRMERHGLTALEIKKFGEAWRKASAEERDRLAGVMESRMDREGRDKGAQGWANIGINQEAENRMGREGAARIRQGDRKLGQGDRNQDLLDQIEKRRGIEGAAGLAQGDRKLDQSAQGLDIQRAAAEQSGRQFGENLELQRKRVAIEGFRARTNADEATASRLYREGRDEWRDRTEAAFKANMLADSQTGRAQAAEVEVQEKAKAVVSDLYNEIFSGDGDPEELVQAVRAHQANDPRLGPEIQRLLQNPEIYKKLYDDYGPTKISELMSAITLPLGVSGLHRAYRVDRYQGKLNALEGAAGIPASDYGAYSSGGPRQTAPPPQQRGPYPQGQGIFDKVLGMAGVR